MTSTRNIYHIIDKAKRRGKVMLSCSIKGGLIGASIGASIGVLAGGSNYLIIGSDAGRSAYDSAFDKAVDEHHCAWQRINYRGNEALFCPGGYDEVVTVYDIARAASESAHDAAIKQH